MARVKTSVATRKRRKRVLKQAKGQFGQRSKRYSQAKRSVDKGLAYAYRDRKVKKRQMKSLWIVRINAACRDAGITYSRFMQGLSAAKVEIDRKMLAEIAATSPSVFKKLIKLAKEQGGEKTKKPASTKKKEE